MLRLEATVADDALVIAVEADDADFQSLAKAILRVVKDRLTYDADFMVVATGIIRVRLSDEYPANFRQWSVYCNGAVFSEETDDD